jgi:hypothetical protein
VQGAYYFHQAWVNHAVVEDMHGPSHLRLRLAGMCISEMKAANSAWQLDPLPSRRTFRFSRDFAHTGREECRIAALAFNSPPFDARSKDLRKVSPRQ